MIITKPLPFLRLKRPKVLRLPKRKSVTIAAGFVCLDGVLLCADTQETIAGYTKTKTEKILAEFEGSFGIAVTGSGDSEALKTLSQCVVSNVMGEYHHDALMFSITAKNIIERTASKFVREHLLIYPQSERPFIEGLLIAMTENQWHGLYKLTGTMLREIVADGDAVGSGSLLAQSLKDKLYDPFMSLDELAIVAAYIIYEAKRYSDGCEGNTDMVIYSHKHNYGGGAPTQAVRELESIFEEFDKWVCRNLILAAANPWAHFESKTIKEWINNTRKNKGNANLREWLDRLRQERPATTPSASQTSADQQ